MGKGGGEGRGGEEGSEVNMEVQNDEWKTCTQPHMESKPNLIS